MKTSLQPQTTWETLRQGGSYWTALEVLGLNWSELADFTPPQRDPQAGYDWQTLVSKEQTWQLFRILGFSWAAFKILKPKHIDPDAGYTWLDVAAISFIWQTLQEAGLTWGQIKALVPSGHWEDLVTVEALEGGTVLLQLRADKILTT